MRPPLMLRRWCCVGIAGSSKHTIAGWMPGGTNPGHDCECLVIVDVSDEDRPDCAMRASACWSDGAFWYGRTGMAGKIDLPVLAWLEVPAWERADKEDAT